MYECNLQYYGSTTLFVVLVLLLYYTRVPRVLVLVEERPVQVQYCTTKVYD